MSSFTHHLRQTGRLALPLIGSHLAHILIGVTDTLMMGWYGAEPLAAVSLASSMYFTVFLLGSGFAKAVMPMVASSIATEDYTQVRRVSRMGLWASLAFGVVLLPAFFWSAPLFRALGQDAALAQDMQDYLRIAGWSLPFALIGMVLVSHLSALGRPQIVLWVTILGAFANAAVNWALIFGNFGAPELGIRGAAIGALSSTVLMAALMAGYAAWAKGLREYDLFARLWRPDWEALAQVTRLGWPIGLTSLAEAGLFTASGIMVGWLGALPLAAHGIALQISAVTFMVHIGLSSAATVRAGHAWGRKDIAALRMGGLAAITLSALAVALTVFAFLVLPGPIIGLFLDPNDPDLSVVLPIAISLLAVAALFQLADAAQAMALGLLRGVQDTRVPMIQAVISYWLIGMPAGYIFGFPLGLGAGGVWLGLVFGLTIAGILMMTRFWRGAAALPR